MSFRPARRVHGLEKTLIRRIFDEAPADAINLGLGQPDLPTPAELCLAGVSGIAEGRTAYTGTAGDPELRSAVADRYPALADGADGVLVTVGSQEALFVACMVLADEGSEVLYPDPGYPAYPTVARLIGAVPVAYRLRPEHGFRLVAEDVERHLTERTGLVVLSAPSNPTGTCHPPAELERLVRLLGERGIPWLSDEVYIALTYGVECPSPMDFARDGGLVVSGLSKDLSMTGWRVGWIAGPREIVARATAVHQQVVTCAPSVSQRAALAAFTNRGAALRERWLKRLHDRRSLMARELERLPLLRFTMPDGAFYFFVDVSAHGDSLGIARRLLLRRKIITIPGEAFGSGGRGHLRLSFAASEADIVRGLQSMGEELGPPKRREARSD
jgi:aspartate/methionine/tyrosine aminotransferase